MKLLEFFQRIDEGRKEQFAAMMPDAFMIAPSVRNRWPDEVSWALQHLKKQDRIVWYLKVIKIDIFFHLLAFHKTTGIDPENRNPDNIPPELMTPLAKQLNPLFAFFGNGSITEFYVRGGQTNTARLRSSLEHFFSLNLAKIDNIVFNNQTPNQLFGEMADIEHKWKQERAQVIPQTKVSEKTQALIKFPDGKEWVNLNTNVCSIEGQAMGHCGNGGNPHDDDTILSLREPVKGGWRPLLTFILDKRRKALGEMKGRGNDKPAPKYHPYIVELLKLPIIARLAGGGYLAQNNFQFSDLSPTLQDELAAAKPTLADILYEYKKQGMTTRVSIETRTYLNSTSFEKIDDSFYYGHKSGVFSNPNSVLARSLDYKSAGMMKDLIEISRSRSDNPVLQLAVDQLNAHLSAFSVFNADFNIVKPFTLEMLNKFDQYAPTYKTDMLGIVTLANNGTVISSQFEPYEDISTVFKTFLKDGYRKVYDKLYKAD